MLRESKRPSEGRSEIAEASSIDRTRLGDRAEGMGVWPRSELCGFCTPTTPTTPTFVGICRAETGTDTDMTDIHPYRMSVLSVGYTAVGPMSVMHVSVVHIRRDPDEGGSSRRQVAGIIHRHRPVRTNPARA